jgi:SET domain
MQLTAAEDRKFMITKSRNGKGIFAKKDFRPNIVLFEVRGVFVTGDEDEEMSEEVRSNTYRYDKNYYISPAGKIGDMLNHSCEPNAKVIKKDKKLFIVSIDALSKGSEVLIDYSTIIAADDTWTMSCNCGAQTCRKVVKQFKKLPKKLQQKYVSERVVPRYIVGI